MLVSDTPASVIELAFTQLSVKAGMEAWDDKAEDAVHAEMKMKVSHGKVHKYLGMTSDFSTKGQYKDTILDHVRETIADFDKAAPKEEGTKLCAAPNDLSKVDEDCKKLSARKADKFHSLVAKTSFATKRARPDTGTSVSYLTIRVREPDRMVFEPTGPPHEYLRGTKDLPPILSLDGTGILKSHVDGSFAVHLNMRRHTSTDLTMGRGFPTSVSTKQKLNTPSSTECELVGVDDLMPSVMSTRHFLDAQGYGVTDNPIYQDSKCAILLERNGRASNSKRTKHTNTPLLYHGHDQEEAGGRGLEGHG